MTHIAQSDFADLARNITTDRQAAMQGHLTGCRNCQKDQAFWRELYQVASTPKPQVPDLVVRSVKTAFRLHMPRPARSRLDKYATLAFDSLLAFSPQGVRASAPAIPAAEGARQMLYRMGAFVADLRMESHAGGRIVLVGQVLNLGRDSIGTPPVRVVLERGRSIVAAAVANEFGEFVLEYEEKPEMRLRVEVLGQRALLIPLELATTAVADSSRAV